MSLSHEKDLARIPDPIQTTIQVTARAKLDALERKLAKVLQSGLLIAFSGGVDSAFLLWAARRAQLKSGGTLSAITALSASFSQSEKQDVEKFLREFPVTHRFVETNELANPLYSRNDQNRCYHCKSELFIQAEQLAKDLECLLIAYGYTASDRGDFRPGHKAAVEKNILAPLEEVGLEKAEIRFLMAENGLDLAEKPASPCLSSRLMTGVPVTSKKLQDVEAMEAFLRGAGLTVFRVRIHEYQEYDAAAKAPVCFMRIEVEPKQMTALLELRDLLTEEGKRRGYQWVTLDLAGYSLGGGRPKEVEIS